MKWLEGLTWRGAVFTVGAIGSAAEAVAIAQRADIQITWAHVIAIVCTALVTYAMKWPTDVTKSEAREIEARVRRESMLPPEPPGDRPLEWPPDPGIAAVDDPVRRMDTSEPLEPPNPYLARRDRRTGRQ